ncbi:gamma-glutamyltransferase [Alsobacter sp. SYSU BS001988]
MRTTRSFTQPGRSLAVGERGMVATSHPAATVAAHDVLRDGGNAVDAAIAAVAVQCVVDPHMTGVGGDCFALYAPKGGAPIALNGSGRAPAAATLDWYAERGVTAIPDETPHAVTVPGAIDAWCRLHADYGSLPLERLFAAAIGYAENGFRITPRVAYDWAKAAEKLARHEEAAIQYLPGGQAPEVGDRRAQPALGATLRAVARHGRAAFYEGPVAEEIVATLRAQGGLHTLEDFAAQTSNYVDPIQAPYAGVNVHECPPNGQGLAALVILRIMAGFDLASASLSEADRIHIHAEATKAAYRLRDVIVCDPSVTPVDVDRVLSEPFIARLRDGISLNQARPAEAWDEAIHRDTIYLTVVDRDLNAMSFINSLFAAFGSAIYAPKAGVVLQNRGLGFKLTPGHANSIAPRKRPMHTIIPGMVTQGGQAVMPFGVMGGQYQSAGHAHFISRIFDQGLSPQEASDAPRSFSFDGVLTLEDTISPEVARDLEARGHKVAFTSDPTGGCQAIWIDRQKGALYGATDHRKDGLALGL